MNIIDTFFFFIFTTTSLIWWLPVVALLFVPFYLLRQLKRNTITLVRWLVDLSDLGMIRLVHFHALVATARTIEKGSISFYNAFIHQLYKQTVWWTRFEVFHQINRGARVLDIGCGNGYLAKLISQVCRAKVTCVDVVDYNETDLETIIYDGCNLPFADKSFDIVILSFVLHHSPVAEKLLREANRVCRKKVIIYEDEAPLAMSLIDKMHELVYNRLYSINSPVTYRRPKEWQEVFRRSGFRVTKVTSNWQINALVIPVKKAVYVLQPEERVIL